MSFSMNPVQSSLAESIFKACYTYCRVEDQAKNESGLLKIKPRRVSSHGSIQQLCTSLPLPQSRA